VDCSNFPCDRDFFLEEIPWVTFVRDRQDADVHVLATRQTTGAKFGDGDDWPSAQYNAQLFGGFNLRLIRGLTANVFGNIDMVRGQIQLGAAGLTQEEILTRQRELATNYRYFLSVGLGYRFGSIFSDVVNRRFDALQ
jgi:hypothetical protein